MTSSTILKRITAGMLGADTRQANQIRKADGYSLPSRVIAGMFGVVLPGRSLENARKTSQSPLWRLWDLLFGIGWHGLSPLPRRNNTIFVSYSRADRRFYDELCTHLSNRYAMNIRSWDHSLLRPGEFWHTRLLR